MELMLLRIFQQQVEFQLKALLDAHARLLAALDRSDMDGTWFAVEGLLATAANVSRSLWGEGDAANAARKPLRDSLGVDDRSPLSSRRMRNHFEHFDDRLNEWWAKSPNHNFIDMNIMPIGGITGPDRLDMFRQLDPTTGDVIFWGDKFSIPEIVAESLRILPIVSAEASKPHWET